MSLSLHEMDEMDEMDTKEAKRNIMSPLYTYQVDIGFSFLYSFPMKTMKTTKTMKTPVRDLCFVGIFTAIIAALSQLSIPMPYGVPMTMQTFAIMFAGIVLGAKRGALSALVYVLIGAIGAPVFAGFAGGMGIVLGMTGGFILSFPLVALFAGMGEGRKKLIWFVMGLCAGVIINYICGMLWFSFVMASDLKIAFTACVLPFIPTDIVKLVLAAVIGRRVKGALLKAGLLSPHQAKAA